MYNIHDRRTDKGCRQRWNLRILSSNRRMVKFSIRIPNSSIRMVKFSDKPQSFERGLFNSTDN